jgi:hypothetical protein
MVTPVFSNRLLSCLFAISSPALPIIATGKG